MNDLHNKTQILVVGAGPVGLMLALVLKMFGVSVTIIDKKAGLSTTSNALIINSRTLEIFKSIGILDLFEQPANQIKFAHYFANNNVPLQTMSFDNALLSSIQYLIALEQSITEQILYQKLQELGGNVLWNTELHGILDTPIIVRADTTNGIIESQWLVGCDGYGSSVRELAGISRNRHDLPLYFAICDGDVSGLCTERDAIEVTFHKEGASVVIPMKSKTRILFEVDKSFQYVNKGKTEHDIFNELVNKRCSRYRINDISWSANLFVHECLVDHYSKGRIIIAGDACHTNSPLGGLGLNTGLQDVWNLGWKLFSVVNENASQKIIASYEEERRPVAQSVLNRTGKLTQIGRFENIIMSVIRNLGIKHLLRFKHISADFANQIAQTDIHYKGSLTDSSTASIPARVNRIILEGNNRLCWNLFATENFRLSPTIDHNLFKINYVSQKQAWWDGAAFCLVRPDGRVAMYANNATEIFHYFKVNQIFIYDSA